MKNFLLKIRLFVSKPQNKNIIKTFSIALCIEIVLFGVLFLVPNVAYLSQIDAQNLIQLTNEERLKYNLPALTPNKQLVEAASNKARDILEKGYFSHTTPEGKIFSDWIKETGYEYSYVGENLAIGFVTNEGVVNAWMESGLHLENILGKQYQDIGISVITSRFNNQKTTVVVQIFGTQKEQSKSINPSL